MDIIGRDNMLITFGSEKVTEFMVPQRPCGIKSSEFQFS